MSTTYAVGLIDVRVDCDLRVTNSGTLLIQSGNIISALLSPEFALRLALDILNAHGWQIDKIGSKLKASSP